MIEELEELNYRIQLAKYDNLARYLEKPGSQMTPAELANIGVRANVLEALSNSNTLMARILRDKKSPQTG